MKVSEHKAPAYYAHSFMFYAEMLKEVTLVLNIMRIITIAIMLPFTYNFND